MLIYKAYDYPENLLRDIFPADSTLPTPPDLDGTLKYILASLSQREQGIVELRYREKQTLEIIGQTYGIGRERVRQILARTLRRLRHPLRKQMLIQGMNAYHDAKAKKSFEEGIREGYHRCQYEIEVQKAAEKASIINTDVLHMTLEEMQLSVRSYNALYRAGYTKMADIVSAGPEQVKRSRNLGKKSFEEIVAKMMEFGIQFQQPNPEKVYERTAENVSIDYLVFTVRTWRALHRAGIKTARDISAMSPRNLRNLRNGGEKSYQEIKLKMAPFETEAAQ